MQPMVNYDLMCIFSPQFLEKEGDYGTLKLWLLIEECRVAASGNKVDLLYSLIYKMYHDHLTVASPYRAYQVICQLPFIFIYLT